MLQYYNKDYGYLGFRQSLAKRNTSMAIIQQVAKLKIIKSNPKIYKHYTQPKCTKIYYDHEKNINQNKKLFGNSNIVKFKEKYCQYSKIFQENIEQTYNNINNLKNDQYSQSKYMVKIYNPAMKIQLQIHQSQKQLKQKLENLGYVDLVVGFNKTIKKLCKYKSQIISSKRLHSNIYQEQNTKNNTHDEYQNKPQKILISQMNTNTTTKTHESSNQKGQVIGNLQKKIQFLLETYQKIIKQISLQIQSCFTPAHSFSVFFYYLMNKKLQTNYLTVNVNEENVIQNMKKFLNANQRLKSYEIQYLQEIIKNNQKQVQKKQQKLSQKSNNNQIEVDINNDINKYLQRVRKNQIRQDFQNKINMISLASIQNQRCWKCINYFYLNEHLNQQEGKQCNYTISSRKFNGSQSESIIKTVCMVLNRGGGTIYIGMDEISKTTYEQPFNSRKFKITGVKIDTLTQKHQQKMKRKINSTIQKSIGPKDVLQKLQYIVSIKYIPVFSREWLFPDKQKTLVQSDNQKGLYIIRIQLSLSFYSQITFYADIQETMSQKNKKNKLPQFFDDKYNNGWKSQNNFQVPPEQIYYHIKDKYIKVKKLKKSMTNQSFKKQFLQKKCCYPIMCNQQIKLPSHQIDENTKKISKKDEKQIKQQPKVQVKQQIYVQNKNVPQQNDNSDIQNNPYQQLAPVDNSYYTNLPNTFGNFPLKKLQHHSLLILSKRGQDQQRLLEQFKQILNQKKYTYLLYKQIYQKLPKQTTRNLYYISHQIKYKILKKLTLQLDPQKRHIIILQIRSQFQLSNSHHFSNALDHLKIRFKTLFNDNFQVAFKDEVNPIDKKTKIRYYFKFKNHQQSIFSFFALEKMNIKCDFVNLIKLSELNTCTY